MSINFGFYGEINRSINSESKILVLGSSRARHHYNSGLMAEVLNESCHNSGQGGHGLFLNYAILNERIKLHKPGTVILDLSPNVIVDSQSYAKLNVLLPYYKKFGSFKEIVQLDPDFSKIKLLSNLNIYNSTLYDFIRSYTSDTRDNNLGYEPLEGKIDKINYEPFYFEGEEVDDNKTLYLNKIVSLCRENNIRLIVVVSPTYEKYDRENKLIGKFDAFFKKEGIEFYDYSNDPKVYGKPEFFTDQIHLNNIGAEIFSKDLAEKIK